VDVREQHVQGAIDVRASEVHDRERRSVLWGDRRWVWRDSGLRDDVSQGWMGVRGRCLQGRADIGMCTADLHHGQWRPVLRGHRGWVWSVHRLWDDMCQGRMDMQQQPVQGRTHSELHASDVHDGERGSVLRGHRGWLRGRSALRDDVQQGRLDLPGRSVQRARALLDGSEVFQRGRELLRHHW